MGSLGGIDSRVKQKREWCGSGSHRTDKKESTVLIWSQGMNEEWKEGLKGTQRRDGGWQGSWDTKMEG